MGHLELSAHMTVRPGCLEGFKKQAAECIRITKEKDTRTLRYDWFLSTDGTECEVREAYTGPEGLIEHNTHILEARTKLFKDYADNHFMTVYGEPSQPLLDLLKAHRVGFKWFTFLQGLEPSRRSVNSIAVSPELREEPMTPTTLEAKVHDFLAQKRIAVAGVSRDQQPPPGRQSDLSPVEEDRARRLRGESAHADLRGRSLLSRPAINPGRGRRRGDHHAA